MMFFFIIAIQQYIAIHSKAIRNMAMTHIVASLVHTYVATLIKLDSLLYMHSKVFQAKDLSNM